MCVKCVPNERMLITDVPHDVLACILRHLPARSLSLASCSCKTLRATAATVRLRVTMTSLTWGILPWLRSPRVAERVETLHIRNTLWTRNYAFLTPMRILKTLTLSFVRVNPVLFRNLPPSLEYLDIHQMCGRDPETVFSTSRLLSLPLLHTFKVSCSPMLGIVNVGELPPRLKVLEIRRAMAIIVREPIVVLDLDKLKLHAVTVIISEHPVRAREVSLACDEAPVPVSTMLPFASCVGLRSVTIACPRVTSVSCLSQATSLERAVFRLDSVFLGTLPSSLKYLELDVTYGIGVSSPLPPQCCVRALVNGVPQPDFEARVRTA